MGIMPSVPITMPHPLERAVMDHGLEYIHLPARRQQRHFLEHSSEWVPAGRKNVNTLRAIQTDRQLGDMFVHPAEFMGTMPRIYGNIGGSLANRPPLVHERTTPSVQSLVEFQINDRLREKGDVQLVPHPVWGRGYAVQGREHQPQARRCRPMQRLRALE